MTGRDNDEDDDDDDDGDESTTVSRSFLEVFDFFFQNDGANFFSKTRSRRCDVFGQKIVKIGAILAIFGRFKILDS